MNIITEEQKRKILEEIIKEQNFRSEIKPSEFTLMELRRDYGLPRSQAEALIKKLLESNTITKRKAVQEGKSCVAYSFVEK